MSLNETRIVVTVMYKPPLISNDVASRGGSTDWPSSPIYKLASINSPAMNQSEISEKGYRHSNRPGTLKMSTTGIQRKRQKSQLQEDLQRMRYTRNGLLLTRLQCCIVITPRISANTSQKRPDDNANNSQHRRTTSVITVSRPRAGRPSFVSQQEVGFSIFATASSPAL